MTAFKSKTIAAALALQCVGLPLKAFADHKGVAGSDVPAISLNELIDEVLKNNSELASADAIAKAKEARIEPSGAYEDPALKFEAMDYTLPSLRTQDSAMAENRFSLSQKIPFPGKRQYGADEARFDAQAQEQSVSALRLDLIKKVKIAYFELFSAYAQLDVTSDQRRVIAQILNVARKNFSTGKVEQVEVLNLQVEDASLLDKKLTIEKNINKAHGELNHLMGRTDHAPYKYGRPASLTKTNFDFKAVTESKIAAATLAKSPKLQSKNSLLKARESKVRAAKLSYFPDFEIGLGYTLPRADIEGREKPLVSGMVGINLPIWAGTKQRGLENEALAQKSAAEFALTEEQADLAHRVHDLYAKVEESAKRLELFDRGILPLSRQAVAAAQSSYLASRTSYETLLNLMRKRFDLELSYVEALATHESAIAEIEAILGEPIGGIR